MKQHIAKAKELFDLKIVYNVVIGIVVAMALFKVLAIVGWMLDIGGHRSMYKMDRYEGRGMMMPDLR